MLNWGLIPISLVVPSSFEHLTTSERKIKFFFIKKGTFLSAYNCVVLKLAHRYCNLRKMYLPLSALIGPCIFLSVHSVMLCTLYHYPWTNYLYRDKGKCRHLTKLTCKGTFSDLRLLFIRVYRLEIQSVMLVFLTQLCELLHLSPSLWFNSPPFPVWISILYTRIRCVRERGLGFWTSDR